jgi:hypothetical protein
MTAPVRPAHWLVPIVAFVVAATVTSALRERDSGPRPAYMAREVSQTIAAPRLAEVPELPKPLAIPRPRPRPARVAVPASRATVAPATATATAPASAAASPAPSIAAPAPATPAPVQTAAPRSKPTPAATFDDSGSGPVFDDSGP